VLAEATEKGRPVFFLERNVTYSYPCAKIGKSAENLNTKLRCSSYLLDIKDVGTMFDALELVQIFQVSFDEPHPVRLTRFALEAPFPHLAVD
jgi:hypothetical protein